MVLNQEAQYVVQDSHADFQEGREEEQSVEDQWDEPDEADFKDVAKENKAAENLNCDDLINIYFCVHLYILGCCPDCRQCVCGKCLGTFQVSHLESHLINKISIFYLFNIYTDIVCLL